MDTWSVGLGTKDNRTGEVQPYDPDHLSRIESDRDLIPGRGRKFFFSLYSVQGRIWGPGDVSPRLKWPGYEVKTWPSATVEVKNTRAIWLLSHMSSGRALDGLGTGTNYLHIYTPLLRFEVTFYNLTITVLDILHRPVFYLINNVSETEFCLPIGPN